MKPEVTNPIEKGADAAPSIESVENEHAALSARLVEVDEQMRQLTTARERLIREIDDATLRLEQLRPRTAQMDEIKAFTISQQEQRRERVERANRALGIGITSEVLSGKSPLDDAMGRKNRRGAQRPQLRPTGT
jgi:chromosome segregation ATPase